MGKNKWEKRILFSAIIIFGISVGVILPSEELKSTLITLAQLNVTIAVGVGALSIAYMQKNEAKNRLTDITVLIAGLSLLTFFIALLDVTYLSRSYLVLNMLVIVIMLVMVLYETSKVR